MVKRLKIIIVAAICTNLGISAQDTSYGPGYQTVLLNNPAFSGSESDGILRISYLNFYPGNNFNLNSFYASYDSYIPAIHGGAGFFLADDNLGGIINDVKGGFAYAYHFQAGKDLFINAGLSAACYYRGYNNGKIILPDQIDPLNGAVIPSGESIAQKGRAVFDIGTGILISGGRYFGSLALNHLSTPDLNGSGLEIDRIKRKLSLNLAGKFVLREQLNLVTRPIIIAEVQGGRISGGAGASLETNSFSLSGVLLAGHEKDVDLQAGCSVRAGRFLLYYNYRFNLLSSNKMIPLSVLHQAGMAFSLNNVDKRKIIKTINFPKL